MRGVFDQDLDQKQDSPPTGRRRDRELTLGPMLLLGIFFGLLLLCGLCFGVGYTLGNRSSQAAAQATQPPGTPAQPQTANAQSKPTASAPGVSQPRADANSAALLAVSSALPDATGNPGSNPGSTTASTTHTTQPTVKPALPELQTPTSGQPAAMNSATAVNATQIPPAPALMVQIATVSHQEDAEALVGALRKRGYAVTVRRDPPQGAFHVEIGPFSRRADAIAMRQKLLSDGYNASLQP